MEPKILYTDSLLNDAKKSEDQDKGHSSPSFPFSYRGHNPLCGDEITLSYGLFDHQTLQFDYQAQACLVCRTSAAHMKSLLCGQTYLQALTSLIQIRRLMSRTITKEWSEDAKALLPFHQHSALEQLHPEPLAKFELFWQSLDQFPTRHGCAKLPWKSLLKALKSNQELPGEPKT